MQADWHQSTGYVPITIAAYELTKSQGFYEKNPGFDIAIGELNNKPPTANSKGVRFGNFVEIRNIIDEELEQVWNGQKTAKQALDEAVAPRQRAARAVPEGQPVTRRAVAPSAPEGATATRHGRSRRIPIALASVCADRAADRDHARLLLLAGGAGALPVGAGAGRLRHAAPQFVWFDNFRTLFNDPLYLRSFRVTAVFSLLVAVIGLAIALLLAVFADRIVRGAAVYKTLLIWPYAVAAGRRRRAVAVPASPVDRHRHARAAPARRRLELLPQRRPGADC